ncbi:prim-pol domain-containing protein [Trametes versicolor FP-101664 SS1]|uniref:prim-pol domain-containing protein n=1 Tax=Trametes versicolor (strain FP-101664) TaxID=717944 RepID=UPI000462406D|nr:prim-pol domain-containing protein [Trametes versicolor FP-101664 SS1]EIW54923.1 prim-pol domain-containing protein [Trametes versicolor FP-101664 SS1]
MLAFYRRLYPFKSLFTWLNHEHAPSKLFTHREFAFTLQGDVYLRYNSFANAEELKKQVCSLNPTRFEIGPVYSARPRDKKTVRPAAFSPQLRELVFDIDMTDYDPIRTCCSGADICRRCWTYISAAVRVLDRALRDQFGYRHLLWVYSGRRGIHLWISDAEALALTDDQRRALVGWLTVIQGGKEMHKKVNVRVGAKPLPPSLASALKTLEPTFHDLVLADQDCFASEDGWEALLHLIPDREVVRELREHWEAHPDRSSEAKWQDLEDSIAQRRGKKDQRERNTFAALTAAKEDIILQYTYPRLDAEVSKHRNHLLKAPFCVHPKTGRVCVPVDPRTIDRFDPARVPTVGQLLRELDKAAPAPTAPAEGAGVAEHHADWERTSLKPYVDMLDKHVMGLLEETRRVKQKTDLSW